MTILALAFAVVVVAAVAQPAAMVKPGHGAVRRDQRQPRRGHQGAKTGTRVASGVDPDQRSCQAIEGDVVHARPALRFTLERV
jgi:hypothetical protein